MMDSLFLPGVPVPHVLDRLALSAAVAAHRSEIERFKDVTAGAEVAFHALSYRDWIRTWPDADTPVGRHGQAILDLFAP